MIAREEFGVNLVMSPSTTLRRRLHHGDVDGRRREHYDSSDFGSLGEPLLGNHREYGDRHSEVNCFLLVKRYSYCFLGFLVNDDYGLISKCCIKF